MAGFRKITMYLPENLFRKVERNRKEKGETRSVFIRKAIELAWAVRERQADIARYVEGYQRYPETADEIAAAEAALSDLIAEEPWE